jgi:hypothetical protein
MDTKSTMIKTGFTSQIDLKSGESSGVMVRGIQPAPTITPEKIECVMSDVQTQIDGLQRYLIELGLAKTRVALLGEKGWGHGGRNPS